MNRPSGRADGERGAALLLALGFVLFVSAVSAGLLSLISTGVGDRTQLDTIRNREYAADSAIETAIALVRTTTGAGPGLAPPCNGTGSTGHWLSPPQSLNGFTIWVDCVNNPTTTGSLYLQRDVGFRACLYTGQTGYPGCSQSTTIISAQVNYEQPPGSPVTRTYIQSWNVNT
ncbi:MAG: hypothetical protein M3P18_02570 [Actinomycetota bacterium]|nr:hypothetical protein [Actinomycetota bacterium]